MGIDLNFKEYDIHCMKNSLKYIQDNLERIKKVLKEDRINKSNKNTYSINFPRGYYHDVNVEVLSYNMVVINTKSHAFILGNDTVIKTNGREVLTFSNSIEKDEFFNQSLEQDMSGLTFECIELINTFRKELGAIFYECAVQ